MRLGVFVGSFDPVHKGHIDICNFLIDNNYVDKVIIIPTLAYWEKKQKVTIDKRIGMLKFFENDNILVNDTLNDKEYTCEILRELHKKEDAELYLIIGADNVPKFNQWENYEELIQNKILVLPRDNIKIDDYKLNNNFIEVKDFNLRDVSSTKIRELIKEKNYEELNKYIDKRVLGYIKDNNLYME